MQSTDDTPLWRRSDAIFWIIVVSLAVTTWMLHERTWTKSILLGGVSGFTGAYLNRRWQRRRSG
jgi:hypothetical protein